MLSNGKFDLILHASRSRFNGEAAAGNDDTQFVEETERALWTSKWQVFFVHAGHYGIEDRWGVQYSDGLAGTGGI